MSREKTTRILETFVITFLSSLFGYIGSRMYEKSIFIPSLFSGLGGLIGLTIFLYPINKVEKGSKGPWTSIMTQEIRNLRKKVWMTFIEAALILLFSSFVGVYCVQQSVLYGFNNVPTYVGILFLLPLFGIYYASNITMLKLKWHIRKYRIYRKSLRISTSKSY